MSKLSSLLPKLEVDRWRAEDGFSTGMAEANRDLADPTLSDDQIALRLNEWLARNQPCLFGRAAAKHNLISYCVLREADLHRPELVIQERIQAARTRWTAEGFYGKKSAFILYLQSPAICGARPDRTVLQIARRLCRLYLYQDVVCDRIYMDSIYLEGPSFETPEGGGSEKPAWKWHAGVNYFCAQADKRWWQDHKIPGGLAFSVNSVGHLVAAGRIAAALKPLQTTLGISHDRWNTTLITSLDTALGMAMQTISKAADGPSGRATMLRPRESMARGCPGTLPKQFESVDCREYLGWYHTDHTLPKVYFTADVERPPSAHLFKLDLTYLFERGVENPAFYTMGEGQPIRAPDALDLTGEDKRFRTHPFYTNVDREPRLIAALTQHTQHFEGL